MTPNDDPNRRYRELLRHVGHDIRIVSTTAIDTEDPSANERYVTVDCRDCRVILEQVYQVWPIPESRWQRIRRFIHTATNELPFRRKRGTHGRIGHRAH